MKRNEHLFRDMLKLCKIKVESLERVSSHIGEIPSPAILGALNGLTMSLPLQGQYWAYDKDLKCYGYDRGDSIIHDSDFAVFDAIRKRGGVLFAKHIGGNLGDDDPAFEIVRHLSNSHYGKKKSKAFPNEVATEIMNDVR